VVRAACVGANDRWFAKWPVTRWWFRHQCTVHCLCWDLTDLIANLLLAPWTEFIEPLRSCCSPKGSLMPKQPLDSPPVARYVHIRINFWSKVRHCVVSHPQWIFLRIYSFVISSCAIRRIFGIRKCFILCPALDEHTEVYWFHLLCGWIDFFLDI